MTLAPEVTQLKYRSVGVEGVRGGKKPLEHYPDVGHLLNLDAAANSSISPRLSPTMENNHPARRTASPVVEENDTNPFGPDIITNSPLQNTPESVPELLRTRTDLTTKTTRSGRILSIPKRYLGLFLVSQASEASLPERWDPEEARM